MPEARIGELALNQRQVAGCCKGGFHALDRLVPAGARQPLRGPDHPVLPEDRVRLPHGRNRHEPEPPVNYLYS
jgi:hypothetical protein